jgi:hypothetical protein
VGVGGIEVPESGEFDAAVTFQSDSGEAVVTAEGTYTIAAE